jgi:transcriptional/translational regulatory protein YebC/TACO1
MSVKKYLQTKGINEFDVVELVQANQMVNVNDDDRQKVEELILLLEDDDDVQQVYHNAQL